MLSPNHSAFGVGLVAVLSGVGSFAAAAAGFVAGAFFGGMVVSLSSSSSSSSSSSGGSLSPGDSDLLSTPSSSIQC